MEGMGRTNMKCKVEKKKTKSRRRRDGHSCVDTFPHLGRACTHTHTQKRKCGGLDKVAKAEADLEAS